MMVIKGNRELLDQAIMDGVAAQIKSMYRSIKMGDTVGKVGDVTAEVNAPGNRVTDLETVLEQFAKKKEDLDGTE